MTEEAQPSPNSQEPTLGAAESHPQAPGTEPPARRAGIRLFRLRLKGTERDYEVDFRAPDSMSAHRALSVIAGAFSTGKSSVLEFVVYCLGGAQHPQHPEILRQVRSAQLEVELGGIRHIIERAVGESSTAAFVRAGSLGEVDSPPLERRLIRPPGDPNSLSSLLLSYCGLEGVELREAPSQAESKTDPMSIRDLMWLCFMPNERLDDKSLLFEGSTMKSLKLRQVVDVVFGIHDDKAVELGRRIKELEGRLSQARSELSTTLTFVDEQGLGSRIAIEVRRDDSERAVAVVDSALRDLDSEIRDATGFAVQLRTDHRNASVRAQRAAAVLRDRETQVRRLVPLRAQYAADVSKLTLLAEAHTLFDPLEVQVCPACLSRLTQKPQIAAAHCSLCQTNLGAIAAHPKPSAYDSGEGVDDSEDARQTIDVSTELRATKSRLAELTRYVEDLDTTINELRAAAAAADREEAELAAALDAATNRAVSPFLSQRDDLMLQKQAAVNALEQSRSSLRMLDGIDRRAAAVARQENALRVLREEQRMSTTPADRRDVVQRVSLRYADILRSWNYPKQENAFIDSNLVPHMRGSDYRVASSGGRTLISLAWILAIFETAYESGSAHPGLLMIDSPQKNLGQGNERDAEFADSVAVSDFYKHLHDWLQGPGSGAQILVVDNAPPETVEDDVVVRYSRRADQPPYGLIEDEVS